MTKLLTIGYFFDAKDNNSYFLEDAPNNIFCKKCGCCVNYDYYPKNFRLVKKYDLSYTYDRRPIVSKRFKEYLIKLDKSIKFISLDPVNEFFLMLPLKKISFSALQKENFCDICNQYYDQVVPYPDFYDESKEILKENIYFTSCCYGSGKTLFPSIILGIETKNQIKKDIKEYKFKGIEINKIEVNL
ncbi:hypothetical protein [Entomomonas asaccharolytica]|uniref:Uncharacterized protein n=1 Tax=Entomomonas asaccharolytica TaxID=2785331 RepID=A0A974NDV3_9GAMM|nr:hypothetical protein [Entomomonas asaccharolytica]QQP84805.1 hypothetical protein JHT90_10375 [Entomomonas asaccharolytica]